MAGNETVIVTMLTPKGVSLVQALTFKQAEGTYEADITSLEVQCLPPNMPHPIMCGSLMLCTTACHAHRGGVMV